MSYLGKLIAYAAFFVSVFVLTAGTDPVNAPKLFLLGIFSFAAIGVFLYPTSSATIVRFRFLLVIVALFNVFSLFSLLNSNAPFSQSLYGVYGRNNGYLLYLFLSLIFISCLKLNGSQDFKGIVWALLTSGLVNVLYALWVILFGDFIPWNNPYGNLLGTFGNPNFAGSFFGICAAVPISYLFSQNSTKNVKILSIALIILIFVGILETNAVQGKVLFVFSFVFVGLIALRDRTTNKTILSGYLIGTFALGLLSLLGALQIGPLAKAIYKESVSLRGEYWYAGWVTGLKNPFFGVGFDSYGDWYRYSRRSSALIRPGIDTASNTAHNVFLDMFSFGGWPLLLTYTALNITVFIYLVKFFYTKRTFDSIFTAISTAWLSYQLQSIISINQIGLAIWGWVLGAAIIAYSNVMQKTVDGVSKKSRKAKSHVNFSVFSPQLRSAVFGAVGLAIILPPLKSDISWKVALDSRDVKAIEKTLVPSYFNPQSTYRYNSTIALFETNNFKDLAYKYALVGVEFNPKSYDSWKNLYQIEKSTESDRRRAIQKMKKLDPRNPQWRSSK